MSGLDKIIARILDESAEKAKGYMDEAREKADSITAEGRKKAAEECERINKKAEAMVQIAEEKGQASVELRSKQIMLQGKQELMTEVLEAAKKELGSLNDQDYRSFIVKLFNRHLPSQDAELLLNEKDKERLGSDTLTALKEAAEKNGVRLTVSDKPAAIKNGFILNYGGVEENCTIDALFDQSRDDLLDKVKEILF